MEKDITNPFSAGEEVICVNINFPFIKDYGGSGEAKNKPKENEVLVVDETLGDFIRFDKYDTEGSFNWWHHNRFRTINLDEMEECISELMTVPNQ